MTRRRVIATLLVMAVPLTGASVGAYYLVSPSPKSPAQIRAEAAKVAAADAAKQRALAVKVWRERARRALIANTVPVRLVDVLRHRGFEPTAHYPLFGARVFENGKVLLTVPIEGRFAYFWVPIEQTTPVPRAGEPTMRFRLFRNPVVYRRDRRKKNFYLSLSSCADDGYTCYRPGEIGSYYRDVPLERLIRPRLYGAYIEMPRADLAGIYGSSAA